MKKKKSSFHWAFGLLLLLPGSACQRSEKTFVSGNTSIPISLSARISQVTTRFSGSAFEAGDRIGLYVLEQPKELAEERYVDNVPFSYDGNIWSSENLYYPEGEGKNTLIAYYPYQENLLEANVSDFKCQVKNDQQTAVNYLNSDFLIARTTDITAQEEAVALNFKHALSIIEIELLPGNLFSTAQELLDASPAVTLTGIYTDITYDLQTDTYSAPGNKQVIRPFGTFTIQEGKLAGISAIIVPQTLEKGQPLIELNIGGKNYIYTLPEDQIIRNTTRNTWTVTLKKTETPSQAALSITTQITDWENGLHVTGDIMENSEPVTPSGNYSISIPDFSESPVYKVMNGSEQLAEICREYLYLNGALNQQAITVYPVRNGKTDLGKGIIAQILSGYAGTPSAVACHGGTLAWDMEQNKISGYEKGDKKALSVLYIDGAGNLSFSTPSATVAATLVPYTVKDERDKKNYSVVKVGTQYWMGQNLKATQLTDHTSVSLKNSSGSWQTALEEKDSPICCKEAATEEILYNYATVSTGKIAPPGWKVPQTQDWDNLISYVNNNAAVLKDLSWDNGTNLTGFSLLNTKNRNDTGGYEDIVNLWSNNKNFVTLYNDKIQWAQGSTGGKSIRCIKQ